MILMDVDKDREDKNRGASAFKPREGARGTSRFE